jgi:phi LC3 family holin
MIVAFIYQVLAAFNVVPKISENLIVELIMMLINLVAAMGIIVDPTTKGLSDSNRALGYEELG